jgi:hypothetical protein
MKQVFGALPHLTPADKPAVRGWCELEVIGSRLFAAINDGGAVREANGDIFARRVVDDFRKLKLAQLSYATQLGLTPVARASVRASSKGESDFDLVRAMAADISDGEADAILAAAAPYPPQAVAAEVAAATSSAKSEPESET